MDTNSIFTITDSFLGSIINIGVVR